MKKDIQDREDITMLVSTFYQKLLEKKEFEHLFTEVAQVNISNHIEVIVDFWEGVLFQAGKYRNNTLKVHLDLNQKHHLNASHFSEWLATFNNTVDELFEGEVGKRAKVRALSIATVIRMRIERNKQFDL